ncbi:ABC transporter ATP-binding protein [Marseilla massiliensis]|uniref:ABC transporter ATP-binding protein n=1 Tax=Marseilla massiliensis TaxID=1841864 RepID=A0A939B579_9BACT|nr:ABC transporter ATP-binding protein [Marseilla massiliensis]MBM6662154.1 ABC transporter ATP-binding protein [Marseilla massiliensis]
MIKMLMARLALSEQGARDLLKGVWWTTLLDIALMLPVVLTFLFLDDWLGPVLAPGSDTAHGLAYYSAMGLAFMAVMYAIAVKQYRSTYTSVYGESANRRIALAEKLRKLPLAFFGEKNLSDLTATIMDDCTDLEHTFSHSVPQLMASLISIALITAGLMAYDWRLALSLAWVVPVAFGVLAVAKGQMKRSNQTNYANKRKVSEHIQEGLDLMQEIKAYSMEKAYTDELDRKADAYEKAMTRGELLLGMTVNGAQSLLKLGLPSVISAGAWMLATGRTDVMTYLMFLVIGSRIYAPLNEVLNNLAVLVFLDVRIDRMKEMESMPALQGSSTFKLANFDICFDNVTFAYEEGKQVLRGVSFTARQGETTALIGPSGGGKTTAAKLAARFWDPQGGRITLGGTDIKTVEPETLLKHFAVVFQDVVLFNATVMENIRIGRRNATDAEVVRAARLARCDEFVSRLPDGYATVIGENGETLSGGERQRISIARAMLKDAPIILLDEATASLDVENETMIQAGLSELVKDKTVIIIAHRMRTIAEADRIVTLENGTITENLTAVERGKSNGYFARMLKQQVTDAV